MGKTLKQVSCKDVDCSLKKLRILPLISFIAINLLFVTSFGLFCYHNIKVLSLKSVIPSPSGITFPTV